MSGKGDFPRPVDKEVYGDNNEKTFERSRAITEHQRSMPWKPMSELPPPIPGRAVIFWNTSRLSAEREEYDGTCRNYLSQKYSGWMMEYDFNMKMMEFTND